MSGPADRHGGWVDIVSLCRIYAYSVGVTVVLAFVYYLMSKIPWIDNLGRQKVGQKHPAMENFLTELQRCVLVPLLSGPSRSRRSMLTPLELDSQPHDRPREERRRPGRAVDFQDHARRVGRGVDRGRLERQGGGQAQRQERGGQGEQGEGQGG